MVLFAIVIRGCNIYIVMEAPWYCYEVLLLFAKRSTTTTKRQCECGIVCNHNTVWFILYDVRMGMGMIVLHLVMVFKCCIYSNDGDAQHNIRTERALNVGAPFDLLIHNRLGAVSV